MIDKRIYWVPAERNELPSHYWEPQPDEEDLKRLEAEYEGSELDDEPLPFE